ncbi:MAG: hypothetical protein HW380_3026 [Magnetococcales bacterium]|nr:hypothetical protein [Magnetococcales bacterium]
MGRWNTGDNGANSRRIGWLGVPIADAIHQGRRSAFADW